VETFFCIGHFCGCFDDSLISNINKINTGLSSNRLQIKTIRKLSDCTGSSLQFTQEMLIHSSICTVLTARSLLIWLDSFTITLRSDILVERFDRSLDDVGRFLAVSMKESEDLIILSRTLMFMRLQV
jgi:hypothetical protein